LSQCFGSL
jgi:hypothetical protein